MGDDTGYRAGRISLNPVVHIDPIGTILFPLIALFTPFGAFLLGWAKPTPVQPARFRKLALGQIVTAGAGPLSNFALAIVFTIVYGVAIRFSGVSLRNPLAFVGFIGVYLNVGLAIFNLIPLPPLDGSWIASWGLPRRWGNAYDRFFEPYGYLILMGLFFTGVLWRIVGPITNALTYVLFAVAQAGVPV